MGRMRAGRRALLAIAALGLAVLVLAAGWIGTVRAGAEGYLYGYPLVLVDLTREAALRSTGPENQLVRVRRFPGAGFRTVVRPNLDTLYTQAFLDMDRGPWVFEMPAQRERYVLMPFMDAWTHVFASPGTRTDGGAGGRFLLAGPRWQGDVPEGLRLLRAPTRLVWLIGRTQTDGEADYPVVHRLQDGLRLNRLDDWLAGRAPPETPWKPTAEGARSLSPLEALRALDTPQFFDRLARLMADNPPHADDTGAVRRLASIGVAPGRPPNWSPLDRWAVALGRALADWRVGRALRQRPTTDGWLDPPATLGNYGADFALRAAVAMIGLGANLPADATYPSAVTDRDGRPLDGSRRYRLHFPAGRTPPVQAFWSITAYGADDYLIANPWHRHAVGSRDPLARNADGSLDLWVQADPPEAGRQANWLPVRRGEAFGLTARLYWPRAEALDGRWRMPGLERMD